LFLSLRSKPLSGFVGWEILSAPETERLGTQAGFAAYQ
jgi:hypothetical protein